MLKHPRLMVFPIVTVTASLIILLLYLVPVAFQDTGHSYTQLEHWSAIGQMLFTEESLSNLEESNHAHLRFTPIGVAFAVFLYFLCLFLAVFFNVAFFSEILRTLKGETPSLRRGLQLAVSRIWPIVLWVLFAGLVGLLIRNLEQRLKFVGRIIARLIGLAWSLAAVFVIPVIVCEPQMNSPVALLRTSAGLLRKTWGEMLMGYVGLQLGSLFIGLGSVAYWMAAIALAFASDNYWLLAVAGFAWLVVVLAFVYISSIASNIYRCALYLYASTGIIPAPYDRELLDMAWKLDTRSASDV